MERLCFASTLCLFAFLLGTGCGEDSLRLSLPDGNVLGYLNAKPSGVGLSASCSASNVAAFVSDDERSKMQIRCSMQAYDASGFAVPTSASLLIDAVIKEQGNSPEDGREVTFTTTTGSFAPFSESDPDPVREKDFETKGGMATATLYNFPGEQGEARVQASYVNINSETVSDQATVTVPLTAGTLVENKCLVSQVAESDANGFVYALVPTRDPLDVDPLKEEPSHLENDVVHNPRDGLLTLVFYLAGEEGYVDENSNGRFDDGEPFFGYDQAEPYVDADDNQQFDAGESYLDVNGNGEWDDANGRWDEDTLIWTSVRILFTGPPHESADTSHFDNSGVHIPNDGTQNLTLTLVDINHNPLAAHQDSDQVEFSVSGGAEISTETYFRLSESMGVDFTNDGAIIVSSFREDRSYSVTLTDRNPGSTEDVTLSTEVQWTPAPDFGSYRPEGQSAQLKNLTGSTE